jgi:branched-chain amino acid transport system substrate-binding protein
MTGSSDPRPVGAGRRHRRQALAGGWLAALLLLAACGSQAAPKAPQAQKSAKPAAGGAQTAAGSGAAQTLKIGFFAPTSGTAAGSGEDMIKGWKLWWQTHPDTVGGIKVVTQYYDTASNPTTGLTKTRQAVEQDHVQVVVGPLLANVGYAMEPYLVQHKIPNLSPSNSADDLTQRRRNPYFLRLAGWTSSITTHPGGVWAYQQGYRKVVTLADNYAFGWESTGGFVQTFTQKGGKVLKQLWPPLGTTDYAPYISQVEALHPDALFVSLVGGGVANFMKQWQSLGLKGKIPIISQEVTTDQSTIRTLPAADVVGNIAFTHWAEGRNDPATQSFDKAFAKAYGVLPSYYAAACYTAGQWLSEALPKLNGKYTAKGLLDAIRSVKLSDSPFGPMSIDSYGSDIENVYVTKVEPTPPEWSKYAKDWNVPIKTYPDVNQFWTYNPQQYLKQPSYSNTFQGTGPQAAK